MVGGIDNINAQTSSLCLAVRLMAKGETNTPFRLKVRGIELPPIATVPGDSHSSELIITSEVVHPL